MIERLDVIIDILVPRMFNKEDPCSIESESYKMRAAVFKRTYIRKLKIKRIIDANKSL